MNLILFTSMLQSINIKINVFVKDPVLRKILVSNLSKNGYVVSNKNSKIYICGDLENPEICNIDVNRIIVNIYFNDVDKLNEDKIIAIFIRNLLPDQVYDIVTSKFHSFQTKTFCVLTSDKNLKPKNVKVFHITSRNQIFTTLYESLDICDIYVLEPDNLVLNYFSKNIIIKELIQNKKIIIGFNPKQKTLGIHITYKLDKFSYSKRIISFINSFFKQKKHTNQKIILLKEDNVIFSY